MHCWSGLATAQAGRRAGRVRRYWRVPTRRPRARRSPPHPGPACRPCTSCAACCSSRRRHGSTSAPAWRGWRYRWPMPRWRSASRRCVPRWRRCVTCASQVRPAALRTCWLLFTVCCAGLHCCPALLLPLLCCCGRCCAPPAVPLLSCLPACRASWLRCRQQCAGWPCRLARRARLLLPLLLWLWSRRRCERGGGPNRQGRPTGYRQLPPPPLAWLPCQQLFRQGLSTYQRYCLILGTGLDHEVVVLYCELISHRGAWSINAGGCRGLAESGSAAAAALLSRGTQPAAQQ